MCCPHDNKISGLIRRQCYGEVDPLHSSNNLWTESVESPDTSHSAIPRMLSDDRRTMEQVLTLKRDQALFTFLETTSISLKHWSKDHRKRLESEWWRECALSQNNIRESGAPLLREGWRRWLDRILPGAAVMEVDVDGCSVIGSLGLLLL